MKPFDFLILSRNNHSPWTILVFKMQETDNGPQIGEHLPMDLTVKSVDNKVGLLGRDRADYFFERIGEIEFVLEQPIIQLIETGCVPPHHSRGIEFGLH